MSTADLAPPEAAAQAVRVLAEVQVGTPWAGVASEAPGVSRTTAVATHSQPTLARMQGPVGVQEAWMAEGAPAAMVVLSTGARSAIPCDRTAEPASAAI
jgi:hypothetical protein